MLTDATKPQYYENTETHQFKPNTPTPQTQPFVWFVVFVCFFGKIQKEKKN
jgi:hypothetical protein